MNSLGWSDVGYNFLIGEDGYIYEGRGFYRQEPGLAIYLNLKEFISHKNFKSLIFFCQKFQTEIRELIVATGTR